MRKTLRSRLATHRFRERNLLKTRRMKIPSPSLPYDEAQSQMKCDTSLKCADIAEAINYFYEHCPDQMTRTDKCKRYAVMVSFVRPKVRLDERAACQVLEMPEDTLDRSYEELAAKNQLQALYMTAIDGFRASSIIGPPLFELIQCLKQIEDHSVRRYLEDPELTIILGLYRN